VDPSLRLAVELPPVPADPATAPASLAPWWQLVLAAARAGAGVVWFTGGPGQGAGWGAGAGGGEGGGAGAGRGADLACDACTIAAAAITLQDAALLGVVSMLPVDRHPAVLARDVTTLDVASDGRAAVLLRWAWSGALGQPSNGAQGEVPGEPSDACTYLGEAVAVCRSVLGHDVPVFDGEYLHVAGAVNRPPPRRPGGPPIFVEVPVGAAGLARREVGPGFLLRQASSAAATFVCPGDPGEIELWRDLAEESTVSLGSGDDASREPDIVCRATLPHAWAGAATQSRKAPTRAGSSLGPGSEPSPGSGSLAGLRARLDAARAAGARGVIIRVPSGRLGGGTLHLENEDAQVLVAELAECFEPWRR
jgi:hypothetical protein